MKELFLLIPGILFPVILQVFEKKQDHKKALLFKTLSSAVFVLLGFLLAQKKAADSFTVLILLGLCFGLIGDFLLSLRHLLSDNMAAFFIGGGFFFLGHLCYLAALILPLSQNGRFLLFGLIASAIISAVLITLLLRKIRADRRFSILCGCYMAGVVTMAVMGIFRAISAGFTLQALLFMTGGIFFAASDTILVENMWNPAWSFKKGCILIALYYAAQLLIACSLI